MFSISGAGREQFDVCTGFFPPSVKLNIRPAEEKGRFVEGRRPSEGDSFNRSRGRRVGSAWVPSTHLGRCLWFKGSLELGDMSAGEDGDWKGLPRAAVLTP